MRVTREHHLTKAEAQERVQTLLTELMAQYGGSVREARTAWQDDTMQFAFHAMGYEFAGTLETNDTQVALDMALPLAVRPFEGALRARVQEKLAELFPSGSGTARL